MQVIQLAALLLALGLTHARMPTSPIEMVTSMLIDAAKQVPSDLLVTDVTDRAKRSVSPRQLLGRGFCEQELTINEFNRCQTVAHGTACDSGLQEELYTIAKQCGQEDRLAEISRFACGINMDGLYCAQAAEIVQFYATEQASCFSNTSCTTTCLNGINRLNDELGCCSGYWTQTLPNVTSILSGTRWSSCGVSPGPLCNNLPTFPSVNKTRNCSATELNQMLFASRCAEHRESAVVTAVANTTGCGGIAISQVEICSVDSSGSYCALQNVNQSAIQLTFLNCASSVASTSSSCSSDCSSSLLSLRNEFGCCINSLFNGTLAKISPVATVQASLRYFTYSLWSRCNVEPPGMCDSPVSDSLPTDLKCGSVKVEGVFSLVLVLILAALFN